MASPSATQPFPTFTPFPTRSPVPTPTAVIIPDHIDLPAWVSDPQSVVALSRIIASRVERPNASDFITYGIGLLNVSTQAVFVRPVPRVNAYFWLPDGKRLGLVSAYLRSEPHRIYIVDLATGVLTINTLSDSAGRLLPDEFPEHEPWPMVATANDLNDPSFVLFDAPLARNWFGTAVSPDNRFMAYLSDGQVLIRDLDSGLGFVVPHPDGQFDTIPRWSPTEPLLAVSQSEGNPYFPEFAPGPTTLRFYDPTSFQFVASYPDIGDVAWSKDGDAVMYVDESQPCILKWRTGEHLCLSIDVKLAEGSEKSLFDWSPDGSTISFMYWRYPEEEGLGGGGLCVKSLVDGEVRCPTSNLPNLPDGWYVREYRWSPDGQFMIFLGDVGACPACDELVDYHIGIVSPDASRYWYPIDALDYDGINLVLWKPAAKSP